MGDLASCFSLLWLLDERDRELARLAAQQAELKAQARAGKARVDEAAAQLAASRARLEELTRARQAGETELARVERRIAGAQEMKGARSHRDFEVAQQELTTQARLRAEVEERLLEVMFELDTLGPQVAEQDRGHTEKAAVYEKQRATLKKSYDRLGQEIATAKLERDRLLEELTAQDAALRKEYDRLITQHGDRAVTVVEDWRCPRCHLALVPQHVVEAAAGRAIHACPTCRRLLLVKA